MNLQITQSSLIANIPAHINWSLFQTFNARPLLLLFPVDEISFEKELMKCIVHQSNKLSWRSNGLVDEQDLRGIFGMKLLASYPKLHELFNEPYDDTKQFRNYIAAVCKNAYKDELDKCFRKKNDIQLTSSIDFEVSDGEGGSTRMIDLLQADDVGDVFTLQDIQSIVTEKEYGLILDYFVAGASLREMVAEDGGTKSSLGRITKELKLKLAGYIQNWTPMMRSSTRPDRMRRDVLAAWNSTGATNIQPFYVCEHLRADVMVVGSQPLVDFYLKGAIPITDRYGLCASCWRRYWTDLMEELRATIEELS